MMPNEVVVSLEPELMDALDRRSTEENVERKEVVAKALAVYLAISRPGSLQASDPTLPSSDDQASEHQK